MNAEWRSTFLLDKTLFKAVEIVPQPAVHADTVRIEAIGRENPYGSGTNGSVVKFYNWLIDGAPVIRTDSNYVYWFNETGRDTINGMVWGNYKTGTEGSGTGTIRFTIFFESE